MPWSKSTLSRFFRGTLFLVFCLSPSEYTVWAESGAVILLHSPATTGETLPGLTIMSIKREEEYARKEKEKRENAVLEYDQDKIMKLVRLLVKERKRSAEVARNHKAERDEAVLAYDPAQIMKLVRLLVKERKRSAEVARNHKAERDESVLAYDHDKIMKEVRLLVKERKRSVEVAWNQKERQEEGAPEDTMAPLVRESPDHSWKSAADSVSQVMEREIGRVFPDSLPGEPGDDILWKEAMAAPLTSKATTDSLALIQAASKRAQEKTCRDAEKQLLSSGVLILDEAYFPAGKAFVSSNVKPYLAGIGAMLLKYPKLKIEVAGYTDSLGDQGFNFTLSQTRAEAVRTYLCEVAPALSLHLDIRGYGIGMPRRDNGTKKGRSANRRVELRVVNMDALAEYNPRW